MAATADFNGENVDAMIREVSSATRLRFEADLLFQVALHTSDAHHIKERRRGYL